MHHTIINNNHNYKIQYITVKLNVQFKMKKMFNLNILSGKFIIDPPKCESSQNTNDFLPSLQNWYLIPKVDKPTCVYRTPAIVINIGIYAHDINMKPVSIVSIP